MGPSLARSTLVLLVLPCLILFASLALSIGLTYAPCYASLCNEQFYPYETRLSIIIFYVMLASTACGLAGFAYLEPVRRLCSYHLTKRPVPYVGRRISLGGAILFWVLAAQWAVCAAFWYPACFNFYNARAQLVDWMDIRAYMLATVITGHHCDILSGLVILPISRNSLLGKIFKMHTSTLLFAHKFIAYCLLVSIIAHMIPYSAVLPLLIQQPDSIKRDEFLLYNPTITLQEAQSRGYWSYGVLVEGYVALLVMLAMVVTSLSTFRRVAYNTFYYCHVISAVLFLALISFHSSSNFFTLIPGLLLWVYDLVVRLTTLLQPRIQATIDDAGNGWYRIRLPPIKNTLISDDAVENPLQTYYINVPAASGIQTHPFTANKIGTSLKGPEILFRRAEGRKQSSLDKEWTWKVASLLGDGEKHVKVDVRKEGPYIPSIPAMFEASHILCITGGTGLTGAYSLANYWIQQRSQDVGAFFTLVWTVRDRDAAHLHEVQELKRQIDEIENMSLIIHISSESGRLDTSCCIAQFFESTVPASPLNKEQPDLVRKDRTRGWVYCSGPEGLLDATEAACLAYRTGLSQNKVAPVDTLDFYIARWQV